MGMYRRIPEVVEAVQYPGFREIIEANHVLRWLDHNKVHHKHVNGLVICVGDQEIPVSIGDWIIKFEEGRYGVSHPSIFESNYEPYSVKTTFGI